MNLFYSIQNQNNYSNLSEPQIYLDYKTDNDFNCIRLIDHTVLSTVAAFIYICMNDESPRKNQHVPRWRYSIVKS